MKKKMELKFGMNSLIDWISNKKQFTVFEQFTVANERKERKEQKSVCSSSFVVSSTESKYRTFWNFFITNKNYRNWVCFFSGCTNKSHSIALVKLYIKIVIIKMIFFPFLTLLIKYSLKNHFQFRKKKFTYKNQIHIKISKRTLNLKAMNAL